MNAYEQVESWPGTPRIAPDGRWPILTRIFEDFLELHGDRRFGDDPAIVGGIATLAAAGP